MLSTKPKLYQVIIKYFVLLCLISMAISLAIYFFFTNRSVHSFAADNLVRLRDQQVLLINTWFHERVWDIKELSFITELKEKNLLATQSFFGDYPSGEFADFDSIAFADKAGNLIEDGKHSYQGINIQERSYFQAAMEGKDYISEVIFSKFNGQPSVIIASPVRSGTGEIIGVVFGSLSLEKINSITSSLSFGNTGETYLVDEQGIMLSESRFTPWLIEQGFVVETTKYNYRVKSEGVEQVIRGNNGYGTYNDYRGVKVLGTYQWLPDLKWGVVIEIDQREIMGSLLPKVYLIIVAFCILILVMIIPLAWYMAGKIILPLTKLSKKVVAFADDYKADDPAWFKLDNPVYSEVDVLTQSFGRMREKITQLMYSLEAEALYDPLTRMANRRHLLNRGREIVEQTKRARRSCTLIFLDIDKFKKINDNYGHNVGDQVLIKLAAMINANVRINDVAGRLGGEEFVVISPDTDLEGARQYAERLRKFVEVTPIQVEKETVHITVSIGVAGYFATEKKEKALVILENLIHQADVAMYRAKELGRNRVEIY